MLPTADQINAMTTADELVAAIRAIGDARWDDWANRGTYDAIQRIAWDRAEALGERIKTETVQTIAGVVCRG